MFAQERALVAARSSMGHLRIIKTPGISTSNLPARKSTTPNTMPVYQSRHGFPGPLDCGDEDMFDGKVASWIVSELAKPFFLA